MMSSTPHSDTPMSESMSDTSCVQENSKCDPPDEELLPDSQQLSMRSSSSIQPSFSTGSEVVNTMGWMEPLLEELRPPPSSKSVRQSRSSRLEPESNMSASGSNLGLTKIGFCCFQINGLMSAISLTSVSWKLDSDSCWGDSGHKGGMESKNSVTTSGKVCKTRLDCGRTTTEV